MTTYSKRENVKPESPASRCWLKENDSKSQNDICNPTVRWELKPVWTFSFYVVDGEYTVYIHIFTMYEYIVDSEYMHECHPVYFML